VGWLYIPFDQQRRHGGAFTTNIVGFKIVQVRNVRFDRLLVGILPM